MFQDSPELRAQLKEDSASYGIELSETQVDKLMLHLDLMVEKNNVVNLTRITDPVSAVTLHLVDSLLLAKVLPSSQMFIDIGTGAGFPGIPYAIATGASGRLLDSVGKKVNAVNEFIEQIGLDSDVCAVHDRAETYAVKKLGSFDTVLARAVAPLNVLVEYASPFLKQGGKFLAAKSHVTDEEYSSGLNAAKLCGFGTVSRETFELPNGSGYRELVLFEKTSKPSVKLPRANGVAKNHPLGA